jgi:hypothetical protein
MIHQLYGSHCNEQIICCDVFLARAQKLIGYMRPERERVECVLELVLPLSVVMCLLCLARSPVVGNYRISGACYVVDEISPARSLPLESTIISLFQRWQPRLTERVHFSLVFSLSRTLSSKIEFVLITRRQ